MRFDRMFRAVLLLGFGLIGISPVTAGQSPIDAPPNPARGVFAPSYGISYDSVVTLDAHSFGIFELGTTGTSTDNPGYRFATGGTSRIFWGSVSIPSGVIITGVGLNYCDNDPNSNFQVDTYDFYGVGNFALISSFLPPDRTACGYAYSPPSAYNWDVNAGHTLTIFVRQNGVGVNGEIKFRGAELAYRRKVSPGPGTATFGDVPTTHLFYQYIEALAAAGITSGCGGGNYCPDAALTRGQMAVFLAKALGLHWPN